MLLQKKKARKRPPPVFSEMLWQNCSNCGTGFLRKKWVQVKRRNVSGHTDRQYCTKKCQGAWLGKNHGGSNRKLPDFDSINWDGPYALDGATGWIESRAA